MPIKSEYKGKYIRTAMGTLDFIPVGAKFYVVGRLPKINGTSNASSISSKRLAKSKQCKAVGNKNKDKRQMDLSAVW